VTETDGLIEHVEASLGSMAGGWASDASGRPLPFQIGRFEGAPAAGLTTYSTLGLSRHALDQPNGSVRQELVMAIDDRYASDQLPALLATVGEMVLDGHRALLRGEVLPPRGPIVDGAALEALYVAAPVVFAEEFAQFDGTEPPTIFAWLVPIRASEAELIASHGWPWFEERLAAEQPDLFDLVRSAVAH
jgi:hypothetical protein